jgi:hypothetical protein
MGCKKTSEHPAEAASGGVRGRADFPFPGQQLIEVLGALIVDAGDHIGEPCLRIDVVELCSLCCPPTIAGHIGRQFPSEGSATMSASGYLSLHGCPFFQIVGKATLV